MARAKWKGKLFSKKVKNKIFLRSTSIDFSNIDQQISIYNGKIFKTLLGIREIVGFNAGEFVQTRKYTKKVKKK